MTNAVRHLPMLALIAGFSAIAPASVSANPLSFLPFAQQEETALAYAAPDDEVVQEEQPFELPAHLKRQVVNYDTREAPGTVVIDTPNTYLYLVLGNGRAMRYGIGVGRDGFTWSGTQKIAEKKEWPDWRPPAEMISRQPYLPRFVAGGTHNPLGARALYLGHSQYRIHGTNVPQTIGKRVSSGCIRMTNEDVTDLYSRVAVGAKVVVLPMRNDARVNDQKLPPKARQQVRLEGPSVIRAADLY
jgi:lipoprotein-anchoring transpeptidase ErfK/SrfK